MRKLVKNNPDEKNMLERKAHENNKARENKKICQISTK
jgi:hypothetical protein